jgi:hypothetical protein
MVDPESIATDHGNVVGQARVTDGVMLGEQGVLLRQAVEIGHLFVANDRRKLLVLKNDYGNV